MSSTNDNLILHATEVRKTYHLDTVEVPVLKGVNLEITRGEFLSVVGLSGSGKSTLLHILGALDTLDSGSVIFNDTDIFSAEPCLRNTLRNEKFGFVFQFYHLLPELTVLENVLMPRLVGSDVQGWLIHGQQAEEHGVAILSKFGLGHRIFHLPNQLSGGERQRVAIARAIINAPEILFADEPTGNLDESTGKQIFDILLEMNADGQTIIMVTHDRSLAEQANRLVTLQEGRII